MRPTQIENVRVKRILLPTHHQRFMPYSTAEIVQRYETGMRGLPSIWSTSLNKWLSATAAKGQIYLNGQNRRRQKIRMSTITVWNGPWVLKPPRESLSYLVTVGSDNSVKYSLMSLLTLQVHFFSLLFALHSTVNHWSKNWRKFEIFSHETILEIQ
jgi:hypothetical protein